MTDDFYAGAAVGMLLMLFMWLYSSYLRARYLVQCAEGRSAVAIEGRFFYVVPAGDYVESDLNSPRRRKSDVAPPTTGNRNGR